MLEHAPRVFEWLGRVWAARGSYVAGRLVSGVPGAWDPILREVGEAYLPFLCANAEARKARVRRFDVTIQGTAYRALPVSRYRVWCLEELRRHFEALSDQARTDAKKLLERHGCWEALWRVEATTSGYDADGAAPFARGLSVFPG